MKRIGTKAMIAAAAFAMVAASAGNASALYEELEAIEGGGGGGGGGSGTSTPSCTPIGSTSSITTAGQGQCARPSGQLATVYIHGLLPAPSFGWSNWSYKQVGLNPRYIAWRSLNSANTSENQSALKNNLDLWCAGSTKPCEIVCHSHGCLASGLLIAQNPGRWNVLKVTAIQGAQGGTNVAAVGAALLPAVKATIWVLQKFGIGVPYELKEFGGGLYDLMPTNARGLYNHDTSTPWKTLSTNFKINKRKCKWWNLPCHVLNFGIGVANGVIRSLHGSGNHDLVVPLASTGSARYSSNSGKSAPCNLTRWTGHSHVAKYHGSNGCTVGPNISHLNKAEIIKSAEINTFTSVSASSQTLGGSAALCSINEDSCNSENDGSTSTKTNSDAKPHFSSTYGYKNLLNSAEVNAYVTAGGGSLSSNYLPYSESTSTTSGGGGGGGGSGSMMY